MSKIEGSASVQNETLRLSVLEELRSLEPTGEGNLLKDLFQIFLKTVPEQLNTMREKCKSGIALDFRELAHSLKSSGGDIGAMKFYRICESLEALPGIEIQEMSATLERIDELDFEFNNVCDAFRNYLNSNGIQF